MPIIKPLSRRTFLRAGSYCIALPFLEAMLPRLAFSQTNPNKRFITSFSGTVVGNDTLSSPGGYGALPSTMPPSFKSFEGIQNYISIISNLDLPIYSLSAGPTEPASALNAQHKVTPAPIFAGKTSVEGKPTMVLGQTADQYAAAVIGQGTPFESLQLRVQVLPYTGGASDKHGIISAKEKNGILNGLAPMVSPKQIYELLFSNFTPPGTNPTPTPTNPAPTLLEKKASVLDLLLSDIKKIRSKVSGRDSIRLEQHFDEIRNIEKSIQNQIASQNSGGTGTGTGTSLQCTKPNHPGNDPAKGGNTFGGWSNETLRGQVMADMISYALACDLTRVVSWALTFDQVHMGDAINQTTDMHEDSHHAQERPDKIAANANWHAMLFARLVNNLKNLDEGGVSVLDNTFLSLIFAEGKTAHAKKAMRQIVAGNGSKIKLGQHFNANGAHPGKIHITGLQSVGVNMNKMNELSGNLSFLLR